MTEQINEIDSDEVDTMMMEDEPEVEVEATDDELAQDALDVTAEVETDAEPEKEEAEVEETEEVEADPEVDADAEVEEEHDPKDSVIGGFRRKLRDSELENARLKGQLEVRESLQTEAKVEETVLSPLELAEAAYEDEYGSLDGFAMSGKLYREQQDFDRAQDAKASTEQEQAASEVSQDTKDAYKELQTGDLSAEKVGKGLDFQTVYDKGIKFLDDADVLKVEIVTNSKGKKAGLVKLYDLCYQAAVENDVKMPKRIAKKVVKVAQKPVSEINSEIDELKNDLDTDDSERTSQEDRLFKSIWK